MLLLESLARCDHLERVHLGLADDVDKTARAEAEAYEFFVAQHSCPEFIRSIMHHKAFMQGGGEWYVHSNHSHSEAPKAS